MSRRSLMVANIAFRLGYGVGGLIAPTAMAKLRLAPNLRECPDAQLFVRGFSAHQIGVAALGLASLRWRRLEQPAAMAIDAADVISAVAETSRAAPLRSGRGRGGDLLGGGRDQRRHGAAAGGVNRLQPRLVKPLWGDCR